MEPGDMEHNPSNYRYFLRLHLHGPAASDFGNSTASYPLQSGQAAEKLLKSGSSVRCSCGVIAWMARYTAAVHRPFNGQGNCRRGLLDVFNR